MSKEPALPLRIKEFLTDTLGMTSEEIAGYMALLLVQWEKGSLPDDDKKLKCMAKVSLKSIQNIKKAFPVCEDGSLKSEWLEKQRRFYKKQTENGKKPKRKPNDKPDGSQTTSQSISQNVSQTEAKKVEKNENIPLSEITNPPYSPPKEAKQTFKSVLKAYPGTKRGLEKEWDNFIKKCKAEDIPEILEKMQDMIGLETKHKTWMKYQKGFDMAWKNFQTWVNGKCWEQEFDADFTATMNGKPKAGVVNQAWEKM